MTLDETPTYNLKVVLKETGLTADTLRAWERRYGVPKPHRTPGGHRLYSRRDIETIKWLTARKTQGLSISRAVNQWNEQTASGTDPLADSAAYALSTPQAFPVLPAETTLDILRARWLDSCLKFNEAAAEQALNHAFAMFPVEAVCMNVLQRGLAEVGILWYQNRASVQQEHFASSLAMRRLDTLLSALPAPTRNHTVIVGCPQNEWHSFSSLLLALLLRRRGLNVIYLGANVPAEQFEETVASMHTDLVVLVAQALTTAASLQTTAQTLAAHGVQVAFGGRIFNMYPNLSERISGNLLGQSIEAAQDEVVVLLKSEPKIQQSEPVSPEYAAAYQFFVSRRAKIEATLKELIQPLSLRPEDITTGIIHLGDNLAAALQLGNLAYLTGEVDWLKTLVQTYHRPIRDMIEFMENYGRAVKQHINGSGRPIYEWLAQEVDRLKH